MSISSNCVFLFFHFLLSNFQGVTKGNVVWTKTSDIQSQFQFQLVIPWIHHHHHQENRIFYLNLLSTVPFQNQTSKRFHFPHPCYFLLINPSHFPAYQPVDNHLVQSLFPSWFDVTKGFKSCEFQQRMKEQNAESQTTYSIKQKRVKFYTTGIEQKSYMQIKLINK